MSCFCYHNYMLHADPTTAPAETLASYLKSRREAKGWSRVAVGDALGVSEQTVGYWERGERRPRLEHLCSLGELFEVSVNHLAALATSEAA